MSKIKNENFQKARRLRERGHSFKEISDKLGISKSTASLWSHDIILNDEAVKRIESRGIVGRRKGIETNIKKRAKEQGQIDVRVYNRLKSIPKNLDSLLELALVYWCEGAKNKSCNSVIFTNSDPALIKYFLMKLRSSFALDEKKFRCLIHLHEYHNEERQLKYWSEVTKISKSQFNKSYMKPHTGKNKRDGYPGCLTVRYFDSKIYKEILSAIKQIAK